MKKTCITAFYGDVLTLIFSASDSETQNAIAGTSKRWHELMFKIREHKALAALRLFGPREAVDSEKVSLQQQYYEKMQLLDQRAKRLADWFSSSPPNPKYTGEFIPLGMFGGADQEFKSFASYDLEKNVFQDDLFFPHIIIGRAIKKYGLSHATSCPLDSKHSRFLEVLVFSRNPHILRNYLKNFHEEVEINEENIEGELPFEIASYEHESTVQFDVFKILIEHGAIVPPEKLNEIFESIKDDIDFDLSEWHKLVSMLKTNAQLAQQGIKHTA
jgi:hypothetical protein